MLGWQHEEWWGGIVPGPGGAFAGGDWGRGLTPRGSWMQFGGGFDGLQVPTCALAWVFPGPPSHHVHLLHALPGSVCFPSLEFSWDREGPQSCLTP